MERPTGIAVIAVVFFLFAGYLCAVGTLLLSAPGTISIRSAPFMYGRELTGPQSAFLVAAGWTLVGWGLLRVRNWARWSAVVLLVLGVAGSVPAVSAASIDPGWRLVWYGGQMMAKVAAAWYLLFAPDAREAFKRR